MGPCLKVTLSEIELGMRTTASLLNVINETTSPLEETCEITKIMKK